MINNNIDAWHVCACVQWFKSITRNIGDWRQRTELNQKFQCHQFVAGTATRTRLPSIALVGCVCEWKSFWTFYLAAVAIATFTRLQQQLIEHNHRHPICVFTCAASYTKYMASAENITPPVARRPSARSLSRYPTIKHFHPPLNYFALRCRGIFVSFG